MNVLFLTLILLLVLVFVLSVRIIYFSYQTRKIQKELHSKESFVVKERRRTKELKYKADDLKREIEVERLQAELTEIKVKSKQKQDVQKQAKKLWDISLAKESIDEEPNDEKL